MKKIHFDTDVPAQFRAIPQHIVMTILQAIHRYAGTGAARSVEGAIQADDSTTPVTRAFILFGGSQAHGHSLTVAARYPASSMASSDSALANTGCFSRKPLSTSRSTASPTGATLTAEPHLATKTESDIPS